MSLSCSCGDYDGAEWVWFGPDDFQTYAGTRRKRCKSCKAMIKKDSLCVEFKRAREPHWEIEVNIWGEGYEVPLASYWLCERCGEIYFNLDALGFCVNPDDNMEASLEQYRKEFLKDNGLYGKNR